MRSILSWALAGCAAGAITSLALAYVPPTGISFRMLSPHAPANAIVPEKARETPAVDTAKKKTGRAAKKGKIATTQQTVK